MPTSPTSLDFVVFAVEGGKGENDGWRAKMGGEKEKRRKWSEMGGATETEQRHS